MSPAHLIPTSALLLLLSACASTPSTPTPTPPTPAETQLAWLVQTLQPESSRAPEDLEPHLAPTFAAQLPAEQLAPILDARATTGPFELGCTAHDARRAVGRIHGAEHSYELLVQTAPDDPRLDTLLILDATDARALKSWTHVDQALTELAPEISFLAAEILPDNTLTPIHQLHPDTPRAVASAFKLWVLLALAQDIEGGTRTWDDTLPLRPELRVFSSLGLDAIPDATPLTLETLAREMIGLSDNTATDHLILELGRERIETAMRDAHHTQPELNTPLLTLADFLSLKLLMTPDTRAAYFDADTPTRRQMLDAGLGWNLTLATTVLALNGGWSRPIGIHKAEWFASANDLAHALLTLEPHATREPRVATILSPRASGFFHCPHWTHTRFKGGSEPGVLSGAWLLHHPDGRRFVLTLAANNPDDTVDLVAFARTTQAAAALLHAHPTSTP